MKLHRIYGVVLRYLFLTRHSLTRFVDAFYYPVIDLCIWGLTSTYFQFQDATQATWVFSIISGLVLWYIIFISQNELGANLLEDCHNRNLVNLFGTPLLFGEWVAGFMTLSVLKSLLSVLFSAVLAYLLFRVNVFIYGPYLLPFFLNLTMLGWAIGFVVGGILLRLGSKAGTLAWAFVFIIFPFSAVFYPLQALPYWAQQVSFFLPSTHIFEGMRHVASTGTLPTSDLWLALGLNVIYLAIGLWIFYGSFKSVLHKGLIKVF